MEEVSLKIYWVTTVWPKWQIIIPKECRGDFLVKTWEDFSIAMIDKIAFWIWKKKTIDCEKKKGIKLIEDFWDISIWTKFQFVIPSCIRKELWIEPWENLIVIWRCWEFIGFMKNDKIDYLTKYIKDLENK